MDIQKNFGYNAKEMERVAIVFKEMGNYDIDESERYRTDFGLGAIIGMQQYLENIPDADALDIWAVNHMRRFYERGFKLYAPYLRQ